MKNQFFLTVISVIVLMTTLISNVSAQTFDKAKLDKFLDKLTEKDQAMGSLALAKDGRIIYNRAIGYSRIDGKDKKPSTEKTKYRIGSITKTFTAVMILQLVEEGKLKLTDTLDKFYPQIPNAKKITLEQMLGHRSGIHSFTSDPDYPVWLSKPKTAADLVSIIAKSKPDFAPDTTADYSNSNYVLLGFIVEKAGGKPYRQALKERIASKIGLADTYLGAQTNIAENETFSYNFSDGWKQSVETDLSIPGGAGAIVSTPSDLTKFIGALFDLKLVSQDSLNRMKTIKDGFGLGLFSFPLDGKTVYGHTGGIDGFSSMLVYLPEEKLAIAYISNGTVYSVNNIILATNGIYRNKPFTIPTFEIVKVSSEILDKYVGVYANADFPLKITVTRSGETLTAQATGQSAFPLETTAQNKFKFDPAGIEMEFDAEKNQMTLVQGGRATVFTKEK